MRTQNCSVVKSVYVQTNWPAGESYDEAKWVQSVIDPTGRPHTKVAHTNLADPDSDELIARQPKLAGRQRTRIVVRALA